MAGVPAITSATFEQEVLASTAPVLVDFWAPWCGPCRHLSPVLEQLSTEYDGRLRVVKVNVDDNPDLAAQFGVQSIPTMVVFHGGQAVAQGVGFVPKNQLKPQLDHLLQHLYNEPHTEPDGQPE